MDIQFFGKTIEDKEIFVFKLKNNNGIEVNIINYGATIISIKTPDKDNVFSDIVLGYDSLEYYLKDTYYMGSTVGRYANRIADGKFCINDNKYNLDINNGLNHLHGGNKGFDKVVWDYKDKSTLDNEILELTYLSKDNEEGYPGNLEVKSIFTLNNQNELIINYIAISDKDTIINLTNHSYFNLNNDNSILNHQLIINSGYFTPINKNMIPTGEIKSVKATPFDFNNTKNIGNNINDKNDQLLIANGYDHNFVINENDKNNLKFAARLSDNITKRYIDVYTTKPGLQLYSGNFLNNVKGKNNKIYNKNSGVCLETQYYPDSPNQDNFPSPIIKAFTEYNHTSIFKFGVF